MSRTHTTHTVDMAQIDDLNQRLTAPPGGAPVTAADLGVDGVDARGRQHGPLAASAHLVRVSWDGAPEFPDIHGCFADGADSRDMFVVNLHTDALRRLSKQLHARHAWGQGSIPANTRH
jgi:hypothetical protein